jgi:Ca2+-binding RTX toxin-like protein
MRRAVLLLVITAAVLAVAGGVALAVNKTCFGASGSSGTLTPDCVGTREAHTLTAGDDNHHNIAGMEGNDIITGGEDSDNIYGDEGNDTIDVQEATNGEDTVNCGPGKKDRVFFDQGTDTISRTCEIRNPGQ